MNSTTKKAYVSRRFMGHLLTMPTAEAKRPGQEERLGGFIAGLEFPETKRIYKGSLKDL